MPLQLAAVTPVRYECDIQLGDQGLKKKLGENRSEEIEVDITYLTSFSNLASDWLTNQKPSLKPFLANLDFAMNFS